MSEITTSIVDRMQPYLYQYSLHLANHNQQLRKTVADLKYLEYQLQESDKKVKKLTSKVHQLNRENKRLTSSNNYLHRRLLKFEYKTKTPR